ncbi:MAG TPA: M28 family peptidase [Flammeovirgaceae bacterium]|nr:M28 family peptidase [Flammeovirgaceae bacterium]
MMNLRYPFIIGLASIVLFLSNCKHEEKAVNKPVRQVQVPAFNADSAYYFVQEQVDFGPRIPNSTAHRQAGDKIIERLKAYGATVKVQEFEATAYDGTRLQLRNIMGSFNPQARKRILLATHWDPRPWASKDPDDPQAPFDGANDGASGVGVLLEIARQLAAGQPPEVGVDLLFFDGEDWGEEGGNNFDSWCLGSQYWAKHKGNYAAYYGILLDMVGGKNARFPWEGYSRKMAKNILRKVWSQAADLGYSRYFVPRKEGAITDDHYYVNTIAKIPMIDILHWEPEVGYFGTWHHTRQDNMAIIDKNTLKAVGQTMLHVVYYEEP